MPVVNLNCRKCGKETTEYAKNKWRCLHCGAKYKYEKPQPLNAVPSVTINKTGRRSIEGVLFEAEGVKVTPSVIFYPEQKIKIPISTVTAVEEKEKIDVHSVSSSSRKFERYFFSILLAIPTPLLMYGNYESSVVLARRMPNQNVWAGFWFCNILILAMLIPLLITYFKTYQAIEEKRSFFENIHLSSSKEPLVIRFSERRLANGFNRAVTAAIAAHV